jgi:hypothetical protein
MKQIVTGRVQFGHVVLQSSWFWRIVEKLLAFPAPPAKRSDRLAPQKTKKADVAEHPKVFDHVGLLFNEPPGTAGLFFI